MIFFSWSKKTSLQIAELTKDFFEKVTLKHNQIWLSEESIQYGSDLFNSISTGINKCEYGMFFITKDNLYQQWLNFEAGALFFKGKRIWCVLINTNGNRNLSNSPFGHIQTLQINKHDFERMFKELSIILGDSWNDYERRFEDNWTIYESKAKEIIARYHIDESIETHDIITYYLRLYSDAVSTDYITTVPQGFETHEMYEYVLNNCNKRLWIYGRKNKKLFDNQHIESFSMFGEKIREGCDFRCLFFNPFITEYNENILQKKSNFRRALETSIDDAIDRCNEAQINSSRCLRYYSVLRNTAMIIIDNTIMFSHVNYNIDGTPSHLTNAPFHLIDVDSKLGNRFVNEFTSAWEGGVPIG